MCAKFGCGPTVVSKKKRGGTDRQTDRQRKLQLYIVENQSRLPCLSVSIIHAEADDLGYVAVKHVLSTLFIEYSLSILPPLVINIPSFSLTSICTWRDGVTLMDQPYA